MASYKVENFGMESPTFLSFILINLSVRKWSFLTKKKMARGVPRKGIYLVLSSPLDLKTRLKLQLEHYVFELTTNCSFHSIPYKSHTSFGVSSFFFQEKVLMWSIIPTSLLSLLFSVLISSSLKIQKLFLISNIYQSTYSVASCCDIRKRAEPFH